MADEASLYRYIGSSRTIAPTLFLTLLFALRKYEWHSSGSSRCIGASIIAGFEVGKFTFGAEINYQVCLGWDEGCSKEEGNGSSACVPPFPRFDDGNGKGVISLLRWQQQRTGAQPQRTYEKQADQWFDGIFVRPNQSYRCLQEYPTDLPFHMKKGIKRPFLFCERMHLFQEKVPIALFKESVIFSASKAKLLWQSAACSFFAAAFGNLLGPMLYVGGLKDMANALMMMVLGQTFQRLSDYSVLKRLERKAKFF
ncbi:hypothetical protein BC829DRAFT_422199 [Chytridium lagenaria]|nr:hypothetical protein BC829DRAFT_422199 [Chytridium lagenaria]